MVTIKVSIHKSLSDGDVSLVEKDMIDCVFTRVSNGGMEQCNFLGQRNRSPVVSQDKGTTEQAQNLATEQDRTVYQNLGENTGRENPYFCVNPGHGAGWDGTITIFSYDFLF